jgi:hypothetical protein
LREYIEPIQAAVSGHLGRPWRATVMTVDGGSEFGRPFPGRIAAAIRRYRWAVPRR